MVRQYIAESTYKQEEGAIIIIMQRLHADDLVAHVQETERWTVLSFSAIAEEDEYYEFEVRTKTLILSKGRRNS